MYERHSAAKYRIQPLHALICQPDLRYQQYNLPARIQHIPYHMHIYVCLAAARHAVEQICPAHTRRIVLTEGVDSLLLHRRGYMKPVS